MERDPKALMDLAFGELERKLATQRQKTAGGTSVEWRAINNAPTG
jgi:hypothetical protein